MVDFPQQHRGRSGGAAAAGNFAIDDNDIQTLARKALRNKRSGNPASDDQRVAFEVLRYFGSRVRRRTGEPRRTSTTKIGLFCAISARNRDTQLFVRRLELSERRGFLMDPHLARRVISCLLGFASGFFCGRLTYFLSLSAKFAFCPNFL
jgi:hypothetical protein